MCSLSPGIWQEAFLERGVYRRRHRGPVHARTPSQGFLDTRLVCVHVCACVCTRARTHTGAPRKPCSFRPNTDTRCRAHVYIRAQDVQRPRHRPIGSFERRCARPLSSLPRPLYDRRPPRPIRIFVSAAADIEQLFSARPRLRMRTERALPRVGTSRGWEKCIVYFANCYFTGRDYSLSSSICFSLSYANI